MTSTCQAAQYPSHPPTTLHVRSCLPVCDKPVRGGCWSPSLRWGAWEVCRGRQAGIALVTACPGSVRVALGRFMPISLYQRPAASLPICLPGTLHFSLCYAATPAAADLLAKHQPDIVVFGHSHTYVCEELGGKLFVNPGSAGPARFKLGRSVAVLDLPPPGEVQAPRAACSRGKVHRCSFAGRRCGREGSTTAQSWPAGLMVCAGGLCLRCEATGWPMRLRLEVQWKHGAWAATRNADFG